MSPIAAYYVMVMTDRDRERPVVPTTRPAPTTGASRGSRIVVALELLVRLGRPSTTQPI